MKKTTIFLTLSVVLWLAGYIWFAMTIPKAAQAPNEFTDAVVVLTGGSGRVEEGLALLSKGRAKTLFISGVHPHVAPQDLLPSSASTIAQPNLAIELGYTAANTQENADEVAAWMARKQYHSLRLVTADYHMRRSLLEFKYAMPHVRIIPHPVTPDLFRTSGRLNQLDKGLVLFREYNKLLGAAVRALLQKDFWS
jgi:uncharacterized SAM-binding protein YcdF (DUF218 family)